MIKTLVCPLFKSARENGSAVALIYKDKYFTFKEVEQGVNNIYFNLLRNGVKKGDYVSIRGENSPTYIMAIVALWRIGAIMYPVNLRMTESSIKKELKNIKCRLNIDVSRLENLKNGPLTKFAEIDCKSVITAMSTSGSSGSPKVAALTFGNHYFNAALSNEITKFSLGDKWLMSLPLYHVSGFSLIFRSLLSRGTIVICDKSDKLARLINKYKITHASFVPVQVLRLLKEGADFKDMKAVLIGGGPIPDKIIKIAKERSLPFYITYGLTEMASQVATSGVNHIDSCDEPGVEILKCAKIKIAPGGEILLKGDALFSGYVKHGEIIPGIDAAGWFKTGDLGYLDKIGLLHVSGRKDNMFISGGENIFPEEIEKELLNIDFVENAVVVPVENEEFGFLPAAYIKFRKGKRLTSVQIREFLKGRLSSFKIPKKYYEWPAEYNDIGAKIKREFLQKQDHSRTGLLCG